MSVAFVFLSAASVAAVYTGVLDAHAFAVGYIVGVGMPDTVLADAFHDLLVGPPMHRRVVERVIGRVVNHAERAGTFVWAVRAEEQSHSGLSEGIGKPHSLNGVGLRGSDRF